MRTWFVVLVVVVVAGVAIKRMAFSFHASFPMTAVDQVEVKELPASVQLEARAETPYFNRANGLFRQLFNYISSHDISMTVPVEADMEPGAMRFYVAESDQGKITEDAQVISRLRPPRLVISLGCRGGYSEGNVSQAMGRLDQWLADQPQWQPAGEAYAVFWHGPFLPGFLKRFEIHRPVKPAS